MHNAVERSGKVEQANPRHSLEGPVEDRDHRRDCARAFMEHPIIYVGLDVHKDSIADSWSLGRLCAASSSNGLIKAAATPRHMEAYAIGR